MFNKAIEDLKRVRKFTQYRQLDLKENNFLSAILDNIEVNLTMAIQDMTRIENVVRKEKKNG